MSRQLGTYSTNDKKLGEGNHEKKNHTTQPKQPVPGHIKYISNAKADKEKPGKKIGEESSHIEE